VVGAALEDAFLELTAEQAGRFDTGEGAPGR